MGRRLNVSTPTVINTELVPLDESFYLDIDGQTEQWYYDNTEQYAPNRKVTPLLLVPVISAFDKDTSTSYNPAFNTTQWFANEWNESQGKYVETEITNQVDSGSADYVIQGNNLLVKKNVSYSHAVTIRCVATYIDPRDSGVTYTVEDSVNLTTNRTADVVFPEVDIISPSGRAYNPLVDDENSQYDFKGVTTNNPVQPLNTDVRRYPVDVDGTEEILNSGEAVAPIMDIRYGNNLTSENQEFMYRQTAGGTLVGESIDKAFIERIKGNTVAWNQKCDNETVVIQSEDGTIVTDAAKNTVTCTYTRDATGQYNLRFRTTINGLCARHTYYVTCKITSSKASRFVLDSNSMFAVEPFYDIPANSESKVSSICFCNRDNINQLSLHIGSNYTDFKNGDTIIYKNIMAIDLTLIYGAGNEPTTVGQFESDYERWFGKPLSYEEYNEGSLRTVLMQSVKTTGFNQWDEEWENGRIIDGEKTGASGFWRTKNFQPCFGNKDYYIKSTDARILWFDCFYYDAEKNFVSGGYIAHGGNLYSEFKTPSNARYFMFSIWNQYGESHSLFPRFCINISNPSKNGTYEPYEEKVQGFDVTAIKGKLDGAGESVTIFPDGLKKAGNIQDEIFVDDGVVKAIKRVGSVDLGSLTWYINSNSGVFYASLNDRKQLASGVCVKYSVYTAQSIAPSHMTDNILTCNGWLINNGVNIKDTKYSDASAFKNAMSGVYLYYELATPQTYVLDPVTDFVWYGIKNGQEVLADTLPWYVSGQGTDTLVVDAMYGENINVVLRCKMMDGETLSPSKAYATLNWRLPDIETFVQSDNGGAVRSSTNNMTFDTIVNVNGDVLSDALKQKHLAFNWKIRKNNTSTEIDKGWGQRITIDASDLRNAKGSGSTLASTLVSNDVYLKGAYEEVTDNGEVVTDGGEVVYDRPVD